MQPLPVTTRIALQNILFATDFSPISKAALPFAAAVAKWYEAKLFLVHAVPPEPYMNIPLEPLPVEIDAPWRWAKQSIAELSSSGALKDLDYIEVLRHGDLWKVISEAIEKNKIDLVVMGTHGRHGIKKLVLGSAAEKIYRRSPSPVLTVGPQASVGANEWNIKLVVFPTDFSGSSLRALPYALSLAEENQAACSSCT